MALTAQEKAELQKLMAERQADAPRELRQRQAASNAVAVGAQQRAEENLPWYDTLAEGALGAADSLASGTPGLVAGAARGSGDATLSLVDTLRHGGSLGDALSAAHDAGMSGFREGQDQQDQSLEEAQGLSPVATGVAGPIAGQLATLPLGAMEAAGGAMRAAPSAGRMVLGGLKSGAAIGGIGGAANALAHVQTNDPLQAAEQIAAGGGRGAAIGAAAGTVGGGLGAAGSLLADRFPSLSAALSMPHPGDVLGGALRLAGRGLPKDGILGGVGDLGRSALNRLALAAEPAAPNHFGPGEVVHNLAEDIGAPPEEERPPPPGISQEDYEKWKAGALTHPIETQQIEQMSPDKVERIQNNLRAGNSPDEVAQAMGLDRNIVEQLARSRRYDVDQGSAASSMAPGADDDAMSLLNDTTPVTPADDRTSQLPPPSPPDEGDVEGALRFEDKKLGAQPFNVRPRSGPPPKQTSDRFSPARQQDVMEPNRGYSPDELLRLTDENVPSLEERRLQPDDPNEAALKRDRWAQMLQGEPDVDDAARRIALREQASSPGNADDAVAALFPDEEAHAAPPADVNDAAESASTKALSLEYPELDAEEERAQTMAETGVDPDDPQRMRDMGDYKRVGGGRGQMDDRGRRFESPNAMRGSSAQFRDAMKDTDALALQDEAESAPDEVLRRVRPPERETAPDTERGAKPDPNSPFRRVRPPGRRSMIPTMAGGEFPVDVGAESEAGMQRLQLQQEAAPASGDDRRAQQIYQAALSNRPDLREEVLSNLRPEDGPAAIRAMQMAASDGREGSVMSRMHYWMPENGTREAMLAHLGYTNLPPSVLRQNAMINQHVMRHFLRQTEEPVSSANTAFLANGVQGLISQGHDMPMLHSDGSVLGLRAEQARHTALHDAAENGSIDDLVESLRGNSDPADVMRILGHTPSDESGLPLPAGVTFDDQEHDPAEDVEANDDPRAVETFNRLFGRTGGPQYRQPPTQREALQGIEALSDRQFRQVALDLLGDDINVEEDRPFVTQEILDIIHDHYLPRGLRGRPR